jgi:hypothetical protein
MTINSIFQKKSLHQFFISGFLIAFASAFYLPYIFLTIPFFATIIIIRSQISKEVISFILGLVLTIILILEVMFLTNKNLINIKFIIEVLSNNSIKLIINDIYSKIFAIFTGIIFILANSSIFTSYRTKEIEKRTIFQVNFILFLSLIFLLIIIPSVDYTIFLTAFMPLAILIADYFIEAKETRILKIIFLIFVFMPFIYEIIELF